jgi:hypothetical protein
MNEPLIKLGLLLVHMRTLGAYSLLIMLRNEVKDFMRMCERLIGLAKRTGELSEEECDVISFYAQELHEKTHPLCSKQPHQCNSSVSSS